MATTGGQSEPGKEPMDQHVRYTGTMPGLLVSFDYPEGWILREERGKIETYRQIRLLGPRNAENTYTTYIAIRSSPVKAQGGKYDTIDALIRNSTSHQEAGTTVIWRRATALGSLQATDLLTSSVMPAWHHRDVIAKEVPLKTRQLFFQQGDDLYEIVYSADARDYDLRSQTFEQLLHTLRIQ